MKKLLKLFLSASLLFAATALRADNCCNTSTSCNNDCNDCNVCSCTSAFIPRSAGDDLRRQAVYRNYVYGEDCFGGVFSIDYRFQRSRDNCRIASSLFGNSVITFRGSESDATPAPDATRCCGTVLADNFGLARDTNQRIAFNPRIENHVIDFELYLRLDELWEGLFFQINAPLVHSKWSLNPFDGTNIGVNNNGNGCCDSSCNNDCNGCDTNNCNTDCCGTFPAITSTTTTSPAGCLAVFTGATGVGTAFPVLPGTPVLSSFCGTNGALAGTAFGAMGTAWTSGNFCNTCLDDTKLASVNLILGYNFYECPDYHFGLYLKASAPTGTEDDECCIARNVFAPRIGDNHWKLGGGLTGHAELYNCDDEHFVNVYLEGYIVHLFERCQVRAFDFRDKGCLSRYMLLREFNAEGTEATGNLINAINFTTRRVSTDIAVQGEGQIEFIYSNDCGFSAGLGWNIYGRSEENACGIGAACNSAIGTNRYGFNGCAPLYGVCVAVNTSTLGVTTVGSTVGGTDVVVTPTLLNATSSNATACSCGTIDNPVAETTTLPANGATGTVCLNACSFTPADIVGGNVVDDLLATTVEINDIVQPLAINSDAPVMIDPATALDTRSGLLCSQVTNKIFGHLDYAWTDCDWTPNLYVGGEVEFASHDRKGAMNAWGVFVGGGVSF